MIKFRFTKELVYFLLCLIVLAIIFGGWVLFVATIFGGWLLFSIVITIRNKIHKMKDKYSKNRNKDKKNETT